MARLIHPARQLERFGLGGAAARLRDAAWEAELPLVGLRHPAYGLELTRLWAGDRRYRRLYPELGETELRATRRSSTAFILGSGRSLADIGPEEWEAIGEHDTIGFSHAHRQEWVRVDYHLVAEVSSIDETAASMRANPRYADTIVGLMEGWTAEASNALVARRLLHPGTRVFRWRRIGRGRVLPPTRTLGDGLVHGSNSVLDVVNFAVVLGWRRIVVAGVDLYNKEYFWLPPDTVRPDEKPEFTAASRWPQADEMIQMLGMWRSLLEPEGIELFVYDPRSLLAESLPVLAR